MTFMSENSANVSHYHQKGRQLNTIYALNKTLIVAKMIEAGS